MPYREPSPPEAPKDLSPPVRQYSLWQRFRRWWVTFWGDTDCKDDRKWAGGLWSVVYGHERKLAASMVLSRGHWIPTDECPHKDFKPVLLMPGQAMDDLYSTCPDCEHWK